MPHDERASKEKCTEMECVSPGFWSVPKSTNPRWATRSCTVDSWDNLEGSGSTTPTASVGAAGSTAAPTTGASTCTASQNCACPTCDQTQTCTLVFVSEDFGILVLVFSPGSLLCSGSCRCFLFFFPHCVWISPQRKQYEACIYVYWR